MLLLPYYCSVRAFTPTRVYCLLPYTQIADGECYTNGLDCCDPVHDCDEGFCHIRQFFPHHGKYLVFVSQHDVCILVHLGMLTPRIESCTPLLMYEVPGNSIKAAASWRWCAEQHTINTVVVFRHDPVARVVNQVDTAVKRHQLVR